MGIKYTHTNIISKDWVKLTEFYVKVFGCKRLDPGRDLSGDWIAKLTGIGNVRVRGIHLSLPGYENGPTLEIFQYDPESAGSGDAPINEPGLRHLAFHVDDVEAVLASLTENGGKQIGEVIRKQYETLGLLTAVYAADPEGNIIEIQNWSNEND